MQVCKQHTKEFYASFATRTRLCRDVREIVQLLAMCTEHDYRFTIVALQEGHQVGDVPIE